MSAFVSFLLGAIVFGITQLAKKSQYIRTTLESLVALTSTIITGVLASYFTQINLSMTILASIIVFIPGLSLTTALEEITSRSLVSGTAKLFDAGQAHNNMGEQALYIFMGIIGGLIFSGRFITNK